MPSFVHWHEGMFLGPQHLQAGENAVVDRLARGEGWHAPYPYGLAEVELDLEGLRDGVLRVLRVSARFRDGTHLLAPGNASVDPLPAPPSAFAAGGPLTIHLAVPRAEAGRSNVAADPADNARYLLDRREVEDENEPGHPQDVAFRRLNAKLIAGEETGGGVPGAGGYETLPLCRLRLGDGTGAAAELDDAYIPPLLRCDAWDPLQSGLLAGARDRLTSAAEKASRQMLDRGASFGGANADDLERLFRLQAVNSALPPVVQVAAARGLHPWFAYQELCRAVGAVSIFTDARRPPADLPLYDHDDLGGCFRSVLASLKPDPGGADYFTAPFYYDVDEDRLWAELQQEWLGGGWRFYVGVASELPDAEVARQLSGELQWKVARMDKVNEVYDRALDSLQLTPESLPRDLPPKTGDRRWTYWSVNREGSRWREVEEWPYLGIRVNERAVTRRDDADGRLWLRATDGRSGSLQFTLFAVPAD